MPDLIYSSSSSIGNDPIHFFFMNNNISKRNKEGPKAISNFRDRHPRWRRGDGDRPIPIAKGHLMRHIVRKKNYSPSEKIKR